MHKLNMSFVFHFYILRLTTWIWTNPSIERLKFESPSKWNSYEGFNLEHGAPPLGPSHSTYCQALFLLDSFVPSERGLGPRMTTKIVGSNGLACKGSPRVAGCRLPFSLPGSWSQSHKLTAHLPARRPVGREVRALIISCTRAYLSSIRHKNLDSL